MEQPEACHTAEAHNGTADDRNQTDASRLRTLHGAMLRGHFGKSDPVPQLVHTGVS